MAANVAVPLCAAQLIVLFAVLLAALWKQNRNGAACWSVQADGGYFTSLYHPDPEKKFSRPRYPAEGYL